MNTFQTESLLYSTPLLVLLGFGLALMLLDAFKLRQALPWVAGLGLTLSCATALPVPGGIVPPVSELHYGGMIYFGGVHALVHIFLCISALFTLFFVADYLNRHDKKLGDVYALLLFAVLGMVMLATGNDLIVVFIGLEVMSVALYIMAGLFKKDLHSNEAGLKYFLLGAFSTGFFLYGIALLYGITGYTQLNLIAGLEFGALTQNWMFYPAIGLMLIGFLFKVAAFPFHSWTPDVYTGAPTPLAGFMATGSKMAAFVALSLFLQHLVPVEGGKLTAVLLLVAVCSMLYGNIVATQQNNVKRMLAYSSIAHTGYLLVGLAAGTTEAYQAVIFYMFIYTLMTIGAFGVVAALEGKLADTNLENWKGLGMKYPLLGAAMAAFLFSLAGIPPLAGFMSKYQIFLAAINQGLTVWAVIGILTSVIGAYYYLRVIVYMYFYKAPETAGAPAHTVAQGPVVGAVLLGALLLVLGMMPSVVIDLIYTLALPASEATAAVAP